MPRARAIANAPRRLSPRKSGAAPAVASLCSGEVPADGEPLPSSNKVFAEGGRASLGSCGVPLGSAGLGGISPALMRSMTSFQCSAIFGFSESAVRRSMRNPARADFSP